MSRELAQTVLSAAYLALKIVLVLYFMNATSSFFLYQNF